MTEQEAATQMRTLSVELEGMAGHVGAQTNQLLRLGRTAPLVAPSQLMALLSTIRALRDASAALSEASDMLKVVESVWTGVATAKPPEPPAED